MYIGEITEIHKPLFPEYADGLFCVPKFLRGHAIVGMGLGGDPKGNKGCMTRWEAFVFLITDGFSVWCGTDAKPYLALRADRRINEEFTVATGWSTRFARKFIMDMNADGLLAPELFQALINQLPGGRKRDNIRSKDRASVLRKTNGLCVYCGCQISDETGYHADHVLPVIKGGTNDIANLVPSCTSCNLAKGAKTALRFLDGGGA